MAFDTFANLKQALINHSGRDDLSPVLDDFIQMAESEMISNSRQPLRLRLLEARSTATLENSRFLELPPRFIQMRRITIDLTQGLKQLSARPTTSLNVRSATGRPREFAVTSELQFDIVPDQAYTIEMQYYRSPVPLSVTNTTNEVLTNHPQIYLFGALFHLWMFAQEEEKASVQFKLFIDAIQGANESDKLGRYGAAPSGRISGVSN